MLSYPSQSVKHHTCQCYLMPTLKQYTVFLHVHFTNFHTWLHWLPAVFPGVRKSVKSGTLSMAGKPVLQNGKNVKQRDIRDFKFNIGWKMLKPTIIPQQHKDWLLEEERTSLALYLTIKGIWQSYKHWLQHDNISPDIDFNCDVLAFNFGDCL